MCSGLQAQILRCYRDHLHEVLLCSDLVKAYQHCVGTARKVRPPALVCKHETVCAWAPAFSYSTLHLAQSHFSLLLGPQTCLWEQCSPVLLYLTGLMKSVHLPGANGKLLTFSRGAERKTTQLYP